MEQDTAGGPARSFPLRHFMRDAVHALALNLICAIVITYALGGGAGFWYNLVVSMCIGLLAFGLIDGVRLALWGAHRRPAWLPFAGLVALAVPCAHFAGMALAHGLLGLAMPAPRALGRLNPLVVTLLASGGAVLFFSSRSKIALLEAAVAEEKARAEAVARQALQAQLQLLQAQIEPHMLFNTLANLQGLIGFDPEQARHMLDQLICYLRATLASSRAETTTLGQEFALIEAYLGLMSVRMGARLGYALHLPPELAALPVPPMLLQPLVENAIGHGLEPKMAGGRIDVTAARDGPCLILDVADTGLGLEQAEAGAGARLALANIRARLQTLYRARASLALTPGQPCGARARLILPCPTT